MNLEKNTFKGDDEPQYIWDEYAILETIDGAMLSIAMPMTTMNLQSFKMGIGILSILVDEGHPIRKASYATASS